MSPDPSVFEEQLREIEKHKKRQSVWRRPFGCGVFLLLVAATIGAIWTWHNRGRIFGEGGDLERLGAEGRRIARTPPREVFSSLRDEAADIQDRWKDFRASGEIEKRLGGLRAKLVERRDKAEDSAKGYWSDLVEQSDSLISKAREKGERAPEELEKLVGAIGRLEDSVKQRARGIQIQDATESDTLSARLEGARSASPGPDYGMDR